MLLEAGLSEPMVGSSKPPSNKSDDSTQKTGIVSVPVFCVEQFFVGTGNIEFFCSL